MASEGGTWMDIDPASLQWRRSSMGSADEVDRIEVAELPDGGRAMRNARYRDEVLWFTKAEWQAFVAGVKDGEFDL